MHLTIFLLYLSVLHCTAPDCIPAVSESTLEESGVPLHVHGVDQGRRQVFSVNHHPINIFVKSKYCRGVQSSVFPHQGPGWFPDILVNKIRGKKRRKRDKGKIENRCPPQKKMGMDYLQKSITSLYINGIHSTNIHKARNNVYIKRVYRCTICTNKV